MKHSIYWWIARIALLGAVVVLFFAGKTMLIANKDCNFDENLQEQYVKEEDKMLGLKIDFEDLKRRNSDTVGWIYVPGTNINYPVVQTSNNQDYLNKRFDGNATPYGTIFMDHRHTLAGNNVVLYGHNQGRFNPVKFTNLNEYLINANFIKEHPYFEYYDATTGKGTAYRIFSVVRADVSTQENINHYYESVEDKDYETYLKWLQKQTLVISEVKIDPTKQAMLLSTCTDDAHWQRILVCGLAM